MDLESREDFSGVPVLALESLRVRMGQLVHSLSNLNAAVSGPQLPPWPALHQQFNVALLQLESVVSNLDVMPESTQRAVVFPTSLFPSGPQSGLLTTLLRKKALPDVEEWIRSGDEMIASEGLDPEADDDFCQWALDTATEITQINVVPQKFQPPPAAGGWHLDKTVAFLAGSDGK